MDRVQPKNQSGNRSGQSFKVPKPGQPVNQRRRSQMEQKRDQVPAEHTGAEELIINQESATEYRTVIETADGHVFRPGELPDVAGESRREKRPRFDRGVS